MTGRLRAPSTSRVANAGNIVLEVSGLVSRRRLGDIRRAHFGKEKCEYRIVNFTGISPGSPEVSRGRRRQAQRAGRRQTDGRTGEGEGEGTVVCGP